MTQYRDMYHAVQWESLDLIKRHLYSRLVTALDDAVARMEIAQHVDDITEIKAQLQQAVQGLAMALNLIKAWSALVHVKTGGTLDESQRRILALDALPAWLTGYITPHVPLQVEALASVLAHPEAFYETIVLIAQAGAVAGDLAAVTLVDARGPDQGRGVWLRAVFRSPARGRYTSLDGLRKVMAAGGEREQAVALKLAVLADLCALNRAELRVQDNYLTHEQALAVQFPAAVSSRPQTAPAESDAAQDLHLAGVVSAPTPHSPEPLPDGPARSRPVIAGNGPALAGPVQAPTPRLGDLLAPKAAPGPGSESGETTAAPLAPDAAAPGQVARPDPVADSAPATASALPVQTAANASIPAVASDEDSSDAGNATGEGQPPDPVEPPEDASAAHAD